MADNNRKREPHSFGRYTGLTPVPGSADDKNAVARLKRSLKLVDNAWNKVKDSETNQNNDSEIRYHFQRVDGGEMWSGGICRKHPLIFSLLTILCSILC